MRHDRRDELFTLINGLPTCFEVVSGRTNVAHNMDGSAARRMMDAPKQVNLS